MNNQKKKAKRIVMVNVLISTYNGELYIEEQLKSIEKQTYQDYHVYIRDDGSRDHTVAMIQEYIEDNHLEDKYTLIEGENLGFSKSFYELLLEASDGEYWAFCDQDDYWYPDKLQNAINWMSNEDNQIPLLYHSGFEIGNADFSQRKKYSICQFSYTFRSSLTSNIFFGFAVVINRSLYEKLIMADFAKVKYHDWFSGMIVSAFGKYYMSDNIDAIHRQHGNNASPLYFLKKIPDGLKLLKGDDIYTRNVREFYHLFRNDMNSEQKALCEMFLNEKYRLPVALRKAFYPKRWNPQMKVELILRGLMLIGKI